MIILTLTRRELYGVYAEWGIDSHERGSSGGLSNRVRRGIVRRGEVESEFRITRMNREERRDSSKNE